MVFQHRDGLVGYPQGDSSREVSDLFSEALQQQQQWSSLSCCLCCRRRHIRMQPPWHLQYSLRRASPHRRAHNDLLCRLSHRESDKVIVSRLRLFF